VLASLEAGLERLRERQRADPTRMTLQRWWRWWRGRDGDEGAGMGEEEVERGDAGKVTVVENAQRLSAAISRVEEIGVGRI
jgi:hypothetical protein